MIRGATAGSVVTVRIVRTTRRRLLSRAVWQLHVKSGYTTSTNHHSQARRASQFWFRALRSPTPVLFARRTSFRVRSSRHPRAALNGRRAYRLHSRAAWLLTPKPHSLPLAPSTVVREPRAKTKGEGRRATCVKMTSRASGACPPPPDPGIRSPLMRHSAWLITEWSRRCSLARTKRAGLSALLTFEGLLVRSTHPPDRIGSPTIHSFLNFIARKRHSTKPNKRIAKGRAFSKCCHYDACRQSA